MTPDYLKRIWIAEAPPGVWSSGPDVIWGLPGEAERNVRLYEGMGWIVRRPYVLDESAGNSA